MLNDMRIYPCYSTIKSCYPPLILCGNLVDIDMDIEICNDINGLEKGGWSYKIDYVNLWGKGQGTSRSKGGGVHTVL